MKDLPLDVYDFKEIIEGGHLYIDKTDLLFELIRGKQRFLSRPRRFGKSLFLTTLAAIFRGQAELFAGLKIAQSGYEFKISGSPSGYVFGQLISR
ncbi:MAG: AAA family ATPase [Deltaproteobacteria bacterium]|nr:AAA family ATPase [Deltaproteobacteria bacterium]